MTFHISYFALLFFYDCFHQNHAHIRLGIIALVKGVDALIVLTSEAGGYSFRGSQV